ncbi:MAG: carbon monoxide dehydrogenase, partial [Anaerolineae bacterium]|nr:carbon monoxide dehydrogenase [Anaerolineae bacterium]
EVLILDMEAGIEHLGRGTAEAVDALVVVVEPGQRSLQTAHAIAGLAHDLRIKRLYAVGNKIRTPEDELFIAGELPEFELLGFLPSDADAIEADRQGVAVFDMAPELVERARGIVDRLAAM